MDSGRRGRILKNPICGAEALRRNIWVLLRIVSRLLRIVSQRQRG